MSDRTPSSVRTGSRSGDAAPPADTGPGERTPVSATQAIPTTGSQRAQGTAAGSATADQPTVAPAGSPPVPPPAGTPPVPPAPAGGSTASSLTESPASGDASVRGAAQRGLRGRGSGKAGGRGPRRARLQLRHIDTWSALKISLVLSIALFFIWMVAVGVLYGVLSALGVFDTLNELFGQLGSDSGAKAGGDLVTPGLVFGGAAIIGAVNIVLMTALCTVGTFIYNLCSDLVGGLELTLSERD